MAQAQSPVPLVRVPSDNRLWTDASISTALDKDKKTTLSLLTINRVGDDVSRFTDRRVGVRLVRRVNPSLQLGGSFEYRQADPTSALTAHENRYTLLANLSTTVGEKFELSNRNLLERRDNLRRADVTVYRNRTQLAYPTRIGQTAVTPFVSAEFFYDFSANDINVERYAAGLSRQFSPEFGASLYYMRQTVSLGSAGDADILGLSLRFTP